MITRLPYLTADEFARRGTDLYEHHVRSQVEGQPDGKVVAIDINSGVFEIGDNTLAACFRLLQTHPEAQVWCVRVGAVAVNRHGPRAGGACP